MVSYNSKFLAATVQAEPVWLDADATIDKSIDIIGGFRCLSYDLRHTWASISLND